MPFHPVTVLAVATLSALAAGGGVLAFANDGRARSAIVSRAADGHFWADADAGVNGRTAPVRFLIDTGASKVALAADDARRMGLDPDRLSYTRRVITAEGEVRAAPVVLDRVRVGGVELHTVDALVLTGEGRTSLLGMSYLGRISRLEATPTTLMLRP